MFVKAVHHFKNLIQVRKLLADEYEKHTEFS